ncbi:AI-2E family transporter [Paenibacillus sp. sptzw28]|uniref:AI-2E family transporter n=1 Tax=Paenibacillus sp. sptzw28 TaxID=715179 RepID=UPI001C6E5DA8|nr:AI-2E family transporter [Paenibacillus sp. sptzw28]QYR20580.1 AI-2E family transporter [Paenibacillus sp. sptzw28]
MLQSRFFRFCIGTVFLLLIIYLIEKDSFIFVPVIKMFNILIVPFMLAGFFYYLLRPIVHLLTEWRVNKIASILLVYLALTAIFVLFAVVVWPTLTLQFNTFVASAPKLMDGFNQQIINMQHNRIFSVLTNSEYNLTAKLSEYLTQAITAASNYVSEAISFITNFLVVVATAPIILYYLLKEDKSVPKALLHLIPGKYTKDGKEVLEEIDSALSGFIVGRIIITFLLGVMMYIGFLLIGLPYSLLIAIIATVLNIIPYIGPVLGAIPCILVAFIDSPTMVLWVLIVVVIAQQVESSLLSPHIYGKRMDMHPLTTIIILLVAVEVSGIVGIILSLPIYMVVKIIVVRIYRLFFADRVEELVD